MKDNINFYNNIKSKLISNEITKRVKDYSKNRSDLNTYYEVGKLLSEAGKHYGEGIIKNYAKRLSEDLGKLYNERTLRRFRQFFLLFENEKWSPMATKLSWSHIIELLSIKDKAKILYYLNIAENNNLTRRELRDRIKSNEYERLPKETIGDNKTIGIIVVRKNNKDYIEYCSDPRILVREYELN